MQNSQQTIWWLEVAKIAIPSLVALIVPFIASYWLSQKIESHKTELGKKLEEHRAKLKYEYDIRTKQYENKVDVLKKLKESIEKNEMNLSKLASKDKYTKKLLQEFYNNAVETLQELSIYSTEAQIALIKRNVVTQVKEIQRKTGIFLEEWKGNNIHTIYVKNYDPKKLTVGETILNDIINDKLVFLEQIEKILISEHSNNQSEEKQ